MNEDEATLSEGEIVDSSSSSNDGDPNDMESPPVAKKKKVSREGETDGIGWTSWMNAKHRRKVRRRMNREKQKQKSIEKGNKVKNSSQAYSSWLDQKLLTPTQSTFKQDLLRLIEGKSTATLPTTMKTAVFRNFILHYVLSQRMSQVESSSDPNPKYLVIWLSNVSEEFFSSSEKHFPKLKLFNPSVQFKIEHPGSRRFVKMGLESFMIIPSDNNPKPEETTPSSSPLPTRTTYLFTKENLEDHSFPVLHSPIDSLGRDCSKYCKVTEWPVGTIQSARSEEMPMFAIDCEMVEVNNSESELARISIVNESLECVYDTYVKPNNPITDYRTRYSGIDENTLKDVTNTLSDVQEKLHTLLPPNSILIGHSLENDFYAMNFVHPFVIDTSCIFTPAATPMNKPSLRRLHKELLTSDIQTDSNGHCSIEDATACMRLVQLKLTKGASCQVSFSQPNLHVTLLRELQTHGCKTGIVDKASVVRLFGKTAMFQREVDSDESVISQAKEVIPESDFTFVQLHDMENFMKTDERNDSEKLLEVANSIDSNVVKLVENCPSKTLVFVVCGSSEISQVKYYQQLEIPNNKRLNEAVQVARTGVVVAFLVN